VSAIIKRQNIESLVLLKKAALAEIERLEHAQECINGLMKNVNAYSPFYIDRRFGTTGKDNAVKYVDQKIWFYMVRLFNLERYMLCTEYGKVQKQIENFDFPVFTKENAETWLDSLKGLILENVRTLVKQVYQSIIDGHYYTGSGYASREKKKRNNNGVDKTFILHTGDYSNVFGYWNSRPTPTDDLEKVASLLSGEELPEVTLKNKAKSDKVTEVSNAHMAVKFCKNGNTHYTLGDNLRDLLNRYGPDGKTLGQDIKIRVFE
jgi:hypothetical protein